MYFEEVYRAVGKKDEQLRYEKINEKVEMDDLLIQSLERSGMGRVVSTNQGLILYYEVKKYID